MRPDQRRASRPPIPFCPQMSRGRERTWRTSRRHRALFSTVSLSWSASTSAISATISWVDDGGHATGGSLAAWPGSATLFSRGLSGLRNSSRRHNSDDDPFAHCTSPCTQESSTGPTCRIGMHSEKLRRPAVGQSRVVTDNCVDGPLWIALTRLTCRHRTAEIGALNGTSVRDLRLPFLPDCVL
jgi:hypothetical protein